MHLIDIHKFIKKYIIRREESLFKMDIQNNCDILSNEIKDKSVLVIGGAGTIGASFIKEILYFKPKKLVIVDTNENGLTELTRDLRSTSDQYIPEIYLTYPMDFGDKIFKKMFLDNPPFDIVANFAAYKHVRSEKDSFSISSMLTNNVFKAKYLLDLLLINKPQHFFCVSTDKAANPVNVMGASKKLMEELIMSYANLFKISTARFANVAFSNGSLLDGYTKRLLKKQPISCPSNVKRFFVSPQESGQICLLACILGKTGEIYFPKLSSNDLISFKKITEDFFSFLSKEIIVCNDEEHAKKLSLSLDETMPYPVYFFNSMTSGEKLFEEFYSKYDSVDINSFDSLGIIKNKNYDSSNKIQEFTDEMHNIFKQNEFDKSLVIELLNKYLVNFNHVEKGLNLDQIM